ncbi:hypothetical protein LguiB_027609 [Lonicera macranthoides]
MEEHKLRCMKVFRRRTSKSLDDFVTVTRGFEKRARNCYAENICLSVDEFVRMLTMDSFFIIEAMISSGSGYSGLTLLELSINYIIDEVLVKNKSNLLQKVDDYLKLGHEVKHLVDLLRICHLPTALRSPLAKETADFISIPNAMQLQEAGIQLLKSDASDSLLDISYNEGVLKILEWVIQAWFEIVLSNILVLENCHYFFDSYVRDYVIFMQMLVDTDKDADLLIQNGIIMDLIDKSSTTATLFNKWKASFKPDYYSSPWMIASTTATVMLLILTFLSSIAAFLAL